MPKNFKLIITILLSVIVFTEPASNIYAISSRNDTYKSEISSESFVESDDISSNEDLIENSAKEESKDVNLKEISESQTEENNLESSLMDEGSVNVSDWSEFEAAYNNSSVKKIKLTSDIEKNITRALNNRTTSIEIDGRRESPDENGNYYYKLSLSSSSNSFLPFTSANDIQIFDMHDLIISQRGVSAGVGAGPGTNQAFLVQNSANDGRNWKFRFGNISTDNTTDILGAPIARLIMAHTAEISFYGKVNLRTAAELAYPGSVVVERDAEFMGKVVNRDVSCFWYYSSTGGTGSDRNFTVLDGAKVNLQGSSGTLYPAIYEYYNIITVGEENGNGADFSITMSGFPFHAQRSSHKFIANTKSKVNMTTTGTSDVVRMSASNTEFRIRKDAEFYAIAKPTGSNYIINIRSTNCIFEIDGASQYDIRDMGKRQALNITSNSSHLYLNNVDISLWDKDKDYMGPATYDFGEVESFDSPGSTTASVLATSSNQNLADQYNKNETGLGRKYQKYSRIAGINTKPEVEFVTREEPTSSTNWVPSPDDGDRIFTITDADKKIEARVIKGWVPDEEGIDEFGNVNFIPLYAGSSFADITLYSSLDNEEYNMEADSSGIYKYTFSDYCPAGTVIKAYATKKLDISQDNTGPESETIVRDATPPEPVTLITDVDMITNKIEGLGEPGTTVTYKINGIDAQKNDTQIMSTVDSSGKWELDTPEAIDVNGQIFGVGDTLQFFSTDSVGNTTPANQVIYRDRTFEKGTIVTIVDGSLTFKTPSNITFGSISYTAQNGAKGWGNIADETLEVTDTRVIKKEWTLKARMSKALTKIDGTKTYDNVIHYVFNDDNRQVLTNSLILIERRTNEGNDPYVLLENDRKNGQGLYIDMPRSGIVFGEYNATIEWNLEDVPTTP